MTMGEGERLESQRRRRLMTTILAFSAVAMVTGFASGFLQGQADATGNPIDPTARTAVAITICAVLIAGAFASWRFFRTADEVEVADNLWASLVGFYVYGFGFPAWWMLASLKVAPGPDHFIIYAAAIVSAAATYAIRKWRSR